MHALLSIFALLVFASGVAVYRGAWLCLRHPDRAGRWAEQWTGLAALAFLAATTAPIMVWVRGDGSDFGTGVLRSLFYAVCVMLYIPFLAFHAGELLTKMLRPESQPPPEPEDPFERAVAAEDRGDVRGAVERYWQLLDDEPGHVEGRSRLARLLARTRHLAEAVDMLQEGLALEELSSVEKADWKALLRDLRDGKLVEPPPERSETEGPYIHKGTFSTRKARIGPRASANEEGGKDEPEDEDEPPIEI